MIQRIQTIYLLLASIFASVMFLSPQMTFDVLENTCELYTFGIYSIGENASVVVPTTHMGFLNGLAALLPFVLIFFYKKRMLQLRFCYVEIVLLVGLQIFIGYTIYTLSMDGENIIYSVTAIMPTITAIFIWLATRGIIKDESLILSLNRIR